jgi:transposase-like protein
MQAYRKVLDQATGHETISEDVELDPREVARGGLDRTAREGARLILQAALEEEVNEFLGRERYERAGTARDGYRNGHRTRSLTCGSGSFEVKVPKITGADEPFSVQSIQAYERTSDMILKTIPLLYAEGLSTRDFDRALKPFWKKAGLSRSSVSRANKQLHAEFDAWRRRDLSKLQVLYLFLDGVNERVRFGSSEKEGVLVAHAILEDGSRELLALELGPRETEDAWRAVLENLVRRGLRAPKLVISDGAPGLIKAVKPVWKNVPRQRCTAHKTRNVLNRVPRKHHQRVKQELVKVFHATDLAAATKAAGAFLRKFGDEFPTACEALARDLEDCFTFYRFPEAHWKRIRTSNVIERAFREVRRRTKVVGRFPNEKAALTLVWASIEHDRLRWRGVRVDPLMVKLATEAVEMLKKTPIHIPAARKYLEAA